MNGLRLAVALLVLTFGGEAFGQGASQRPLWTTSKFRGSPEPPPPYRAVPLYPKLKFEKTTVLAIPPGSDRLFVGERAGKIYSLPADRNATSASLFLDTAALAGRLTIDGQPMAFESLYGLTFDPDFERNRFCYVCYVVHPKQRAGSEFKEGTRVSRFRVSQTEPPVCEVDSEKLIIAWLQGGHNGGCVKFGPDGCLYISSGDGGVAFPPDGLISGQDMTTLLAKVLRIDVRREENGRPYAIPADNPFVNLPGARGETWAYGLRNPWKMSFDRKTGALWVGDVGWELWELVYRVNKGDNFGWSIVEGRQQVHTDRPRGPTPIVPPTLEIPHTDGASVTGGYVYRGQKLPELYGHYIFGDWETRRVWGVNVDGKELGRRRDLIAATVRIVDFAEDAAGELYLLDHDDGSILTLVPQAATKDERPFPRRLSETGLFASVARHEPETGVLPFEINVEQWSDGASAERWLAVPGSEPIRLHSRPHAIEGSQFSRATDYPVDTVLVKTLSFEMERGNPASRRRIETQTLHFDGRDWQAYTYEWNDEQTDATLVESSGKDRPLQLIDPEAPGGKRTQTWRFSSRAECLRCHNPWSEYALAFNLGQINRDGTVFGKTGNQIASLRELGLFVDMPPPVDPKNPDAKPAPPKEPAQLPRLTPPFDAAGDIDARARSYLHVNCGHCHRYNGGGSSYIFLQHELSLFNLRAVGVRPTQGTFGIANPQLIAAGDPYSSVLYFRMAKSGAGHMPHLGANLPDDRALALVHEWIRQLPVMVDETAKVERLVKLGAAKQPRTDDERRKLAAELLETPSRALLLADAVRQKKIPAPAVAIAMELSQQTTTDPAIRDLFEAFLPEEQRARRLGETINPDDILPLAGDVARGRQLFHESTVVQCRSCHRIGGQGTNLGPELDAIGKKYDRPKLLESILQPSLHVDPKYTLYLVETKAGTVHSGLLAYRDSAGIELKDAQNRSLRIATGDIEQMIPQKQSQMPEKLLRDFTPQQAADLLAYLASLKQEPAPPPAESK